MTLCSKLSSAERELLKRLCLENEAIQRVLKTKTDKQRRPNGVYKEAAQELRKACFADLGLVQADDESDEDFFERVWVRASAVPRPALFAAELNQDRDSFAVWYEQFCKVSDEAGFGVRGC